MSKARSDKVVVLGVGNELLMDEGIGVHVARELAGRTFAFPVEIIEAGTVLDCWQGDEPVSKLVVIDAVYGGSEPGAIYRFSPEDVEFETCLMTSIHQLSFVDSLKLSEITGHQARENSHHRNRAKRSCMGNGAFGRTPRPYLRRH